MVSYLLRRGLEPPHIAVYAPEAYVSANSTTSALKVVYRFYCKIKGIHYNILYEIKLIKILRYG